MSLILQFCKTARPPLTWFTQCFSGLLDDTFLNASSTVATAGNMSRCVLSVIAIAVLQPLINLMGKVGF